MWYNNYSEFRKELIIMKCVLELAVMRAEADKAYEQEQMRLDNEAKSAFMEATEKAINYCETVIGTHFESQAQNRKDIEYSFKGVILKDRLGNELIAPYTKVVPMLMAHLPINIIPKKQWLWLHLNNI